MAKVKEFLAGNGGLLFFVILLVALWVFAFISIFFGNGFFGCSSFAHFCMPGHFCRFCGEQLRDLPVICPNCDTRVVHDFCSGCGWSVSGG